MKGAASTPARIRSSSTLASFSWCKKRKKAGEIQMCEPSRFIEELPKDDVRHFGNPFNDPIVSKDYGKEKMASIRAMLKSGS
jgi:ATP-dependent DNA helicase Rep